MMFISQLKSYSKTNMYKDKQFDVPITLRVGEPTYVESSEVHQ